MISLFGFLLFLFLFVVGHFTSALFIYFVHRFVFHGSLRRYPGLKHLARLHGLHHAHVDTDVDQYIFVPWWIKVTLVLVIGTLAILNIGLALGVASFGALYAYRHWAIHHHDFTSRFHHHHDFHHRGNTKKNFSGMYPFIDRVFGTYFEARPNWKQKKILSPKENL